MIATVIGTTHRCNLGAFKARPSTAERTDTAGVNAPSPLNEAGEIRRRETEKLNPTN